MRPSKHATDVNPLHTRYHALIGTGGIGRGSSSRSMGITRWGARRAAAGAFSTGAITASCTSSATTSACCWGRLPGHPAGDGRRGRSGRRLLAEMAEVGLDLRFVGRANRTLFSLCLVYPDGSGGNLTVNDSACEAVVPAGCPGRDRVRPLRWRGDRAGGARSAPLCQAPPARTGHGPRLLARGRLHQRRASSGRGRAGRV